MREGGEREERGRREGGEREERGRREGGERKERGRREGGVDTESFKFSLLSTHAALISKFYQIISYIKNQIK